MQSIGERIHLLRLHIGWSVEECAYRMTIESNSHTTPNTWLEWERSTDQHAFANGLFDQLDAVITVLAADPKWLREGDTESVNLSNQVLPFPAR
jgi:transcriptional regulator with XRE-family HTH domain